MGRLVNPRTQVTVTPNKRNDQQREPREMKVRSACPSQQPIISGRTQVAVIVLVLRK